MKRFSSKIINNYCDRSRTSMSQLRLAMHHFYLYMYMYDASPTTLTGQICGIVECAFLPMTGDREAASANGSRRPNLASVKICRENLGFTASCTLVRLFVTVVWNRTVNADFPPPEKNCIHLNAVFLRRRKVRVHSSIQTTVLVARKNVRPYTLLKTSLLSHGET